jgi:hypothetical protein
LLNKLVGTLRGHVAASREVAVKVSRVDDQRESQANKELAMVQKIDVAVIGGSEKRVKTHRARPRNTYRIALDGRACLSRHNKARKHRSTNSMKITNICA